MLSACQHPLDTRHAFLSRGLIARFKRETTPLCRCNSISSSPLGAFLRPENTRGRGFRLPRSEYVGFCHLPKFVHLTDERGVRPTFPRLSCANQKTKRKIPRFGRVCWLAATAEKRKSKRCRSSSALSAPEDIFAPEGRERLRTMKRFG